jgi:hypothetical protein
MTGVTLKTLTNAFLVIGALLLTSTSAFAAEELIMTDGYLSLRSYVSYKTLPREVKNPGIELEKIRIEVTGRDCNLEISRLEFQSNSRGNVYRAYELGNNEFLIGGNQVFSLSITFVQEGPSYVACDLAFIGEKVDSAPDLRELREASADAKRHSGLFALDVSDHEGYSSVAGDANAYYRGIKEFISLTATARDINAIKLGFGNIDFDFNLVSREFYRAHADALDDAMLEQYQDLKARHAAMANAVANLR